MRSPRIWFGLTLLSVVIGVGALWLLRTKRLPVAGVTPAAGGASDRTTANVLPAAERSASVAHGEIHVPPSLAPSFAAAPTLSVQPAVPAALQSGADVPVPEMAAGDTVEASAPDELAASGRMYGAHASLRSFAVANPDSPENKRILQTMITKALARPSAAAPATETP